MDGQLVGCRNGQTDPAKPIQRHIEFKSKNPHTCTHTKIAISHIHIALTDRSTDGQTDKQTDRQTNRRINRYEFKRE